MNKNTGIYKYIKKLYKKIIWELSAISPTLATKILYFRVFKKRLNLKRPRSLNEKILYLKLNDYYNNPLITQCADKVMVREYVKKKGLSYILNEKLLVVSNPLEIDYSILPNKFVMKCNHCSGGNIICRDKAKLDIEKTNRQLLEYLKEDYWKEYAEVNYKFIEKKIIVERFIETQNGNLPTDYRIMCCNGEPKFLYLTTWGITDTLERYYLDCDWVSLDIGNTKNLLKPEKPKKLSEMLDIARILSKDFKFVRVDLFNVEGKIYFGELTFTPTGALTKDFDNEIVNNLLIL